MRFTSFNDIGLKCIAALKNLNIKLGLRLFYSRFSFLITNKPYRCHIEITSQCFLNCPLCTAPKEFLIRKDNILSFKKFKNLLDTLPYFISEIELHLSGDPLSHPNILEILECISSKNIWCSVHTTLDNYVDIIDSPMFYKYSPNMLIIMLDGFNNDHEMVRKGSSFNRLVENLKKIRVSKKTELAVQTLITNKNQYYLDEIKKFTTNLGIKNHKFKTIAIPRMFLSHEKQYDLALKFLPGSADKRYNIDNINKTIIPINISPSCFMNNTIFITSDGNLAACCYDINAKYGKENVLDIRKILKSNSFKEMSKKVIKKDLPLCQLCDIS